MRFLLLILIAIPVAGIADSITPSHRCNRPATLSALAGDAEKFAHERQVAAYRQCLGDFIREQERAARVHSDAARQAQNELSRVQ